MREAEQRAFLRAAVLLLGISLLRWTATIKTPHPGEGLGGADDVLAEHQTATSTAMSEAERRSRPLDEGERIDPNTADDVELDRLPGVGPATARAIVAARDSGIVFKRSEDLLVVRGIGPSSLARVRPWIALGNAGHEARTTATRRLGNAHRTVGREPDSGVVDVNRADASALQALPGIGPSLADRIVDERGRRPFDSVDDLVRVRGIGPATVERLRPFVLAGRLR